MSRIVRRVLFVSCTFAITGAMFVLGHPRVGASEFASDAVPKVNKFPGPPPICPHWAYEPWVWEDNGNTRKITEALVEGYRSRNIPVGAVLIDSPWSTAYNNFEWDTERYPKSQEMIDEFHAKGVKVVLWLTGVVNRKSKDTPLQKSATYDLVKKRGYGVNDGRNYIWWNGEGVHIDFMNPKAKAWWHTQLDKVLEMGIDGWKTDIGSLAIGPFVDTSIGTITRSQFCRYHYADTICDSPRLSDAGRSDFYAAIAVACSASYWSGYL